MHFQPHSDEAPVTKMHKMDIAKSDANCVKATTTTTMTMTKTMTRLVIDDCATAFFFF